ncbi:uncharacterized protein E0L32_008023 [Thyridium curvatum]|uniref:Amino acid transporter transmembrane domain-containing protein n=1 Tax=Thyridium curvatum TaxID=1093900 RepID=A0A507AW73_9PEZI|nr:uncharacterized protein E0L32_008023 [Thyridium curvatum]TPX10986.1 hypothetical protein E0L32_008023 [Thyridium curvatum]
MPQATSHGATNPASSSTNDAPPRPDDHDDGFSRAAAPDDGEEDIGLLHAHADIDDDDDDLVILPGGAEEEPKGRDTSSPPRTPGHVRFDLPPPPTAAANGHANGHPREALGVADDGGDEYFSDDSDDDDAALLSRDPLASRPLLTGLEAPAVALANSGRLSPTPRGRGPAAAGEDGQDSSAELAAEEERLRPKSGLRSAFMNMANSIIGAGIIGQPYAFRQAGLVAGVALLVGLTVMVDWTICLIVVNSKLSGASSFQGTVERCFGRPGLVAVSLAQWLFAFGGMVAFCVIVGDSIPHVLLAVWPSIRDVPVVGLLANRRVAIVVFVIGVSYPLTLYRDIAKLSKASTFALISMMVICVTVVVQGILTPRAERGSFSAPLLTINSGIFQAIGVISFAFVCHHNSLLIYGSLKTPTIDRFSRVTHYSTGVSMLACMLMALAGFLTFGDRTLGNVLNNFPSDNAMVNVARLCFGLNMLTTLPLEGFVCREVMLDYWWRGAAFDLRLHVLLSTGLVAAATALSLFTCDLGVIFELVGATSACAMAYILPPLCYVKLTARRDWRTYAAGAVVVFGCAVMVISVVQAVAKIVSGEFSPFFFLAFICWSFVCRVCEGGMAQCV